MKLKAQFQPSNAFELFAVVDPYKNAPVAAVDNARVPLRPKFGNSTAAPPTSDPGTPTAATIKEFL